MEEVKREFDLAKADNAHLHAQVASMAKEMGQKNEEIRKYHAEQAVVFKSGNSLGIRAKWWPKPNCTISWEKKETQNPPNRPSPSS